MTPRPHYQDAQALRRALEVRLRRRAHDSAVPLDRLRKEVAHQRLLARLALTAPQGAWALKGGLVLLARLDQNTRAAKDADAIGGPHSRRSLTPSKQRSRPICATASRSRSLRRGYCRERQTRAARATRSSPYWTAASSSVCNSTSTSFLMTAGRWSTFDCATSYRSRASNRLRCR